jgi:uroporphyrinogen-III synthase
MRALLILRPEPGASESLARAARLGLNAVAAPLFTVGPLAWEAPDPRRYDAILLTSANAARHGGEKLRRYAHLPCFAVGEATAAAAGTAGFEVVATGASDGAAIAARMAERGVARALHPCGREHVPLPGPIDHLPVYASDAVAALPPAAMDTIRAGAVVALHSPRGARLFAALADDAGLDRADIALAAISEAAAAAAGDGWRARAVGPAPGDEALLVLAAKLCQNQDAATKLGG